MKFLYPFLALLLLISCNESKNETIDFSKISPENGNKPNALSTKDSLLNQRPKQSFFLDLADSLFMKSQWKVLDTFFFVDRFRPKSTEKWNLISEKDSIVLCNYQFNDSMETKNALFNWLDNFGSNRVAYTLGSNLKRKGRNVLILVSEKSMVEIDSKNKLNVFKIRSVLSKKKENENYLYLIDACLGAKTTWKRVVKGEEKNIKAYEASR